MCRASHILKVESMSQHHHHHHDHKHEEHSFKNVEDYVARFDAPDRDEWQKPDEVFDVIGLKQGDKIVDFGAGTGYFSVRASERVGKGIVYAIDSEPEMLNYLAKRTSKAELTNVEIILVEHDEIELPEPVDVILLVNVYHHINDRVSKFNRVKQWLRDGGKIVVIEARAGTPIEPPAHFLMTEEQVASEFAEAGYKLISDSKILPYQSLQIFGA